MDLQVWNWSQKGSFPSNMDEAHRLIDLVMKQLETTEWSSKEQFSINLALEEALVNAVQHGNHSDLSKRVHYDFRLNDDQVFFQIEDEGEGFDPDEIPDPTDEEHIMIASGRGVLLIRNLVSQAEWNDKGNILTMRKFREK